MRYAIISDIHSNIESLSVFIKLLPKLKVDNIICLGDVVGYNANPVECINILSEISSLEIIRGNHDRAVATGDFYNFSNNAADAVRWTIKNIDAVSFYFLNSLQQGPKKINQTFGISHGSPLHEDMYILNSYHAKMCFEWMKKENMQIMFFGHTHYQTAFCLNADNVINKIKSSNFKIEKKCFYLINPGSIGQPRDNNPKAGFLIFDFDNLMINFIRYEYNIEAAQKKIIKNNLPEGLAVRLSFGR